MNGPDSFLKDSNGCYFLDRSPRPFEVILDFLRTGHLHNLNGCTLGQLEVEADFFGLTGLQDILRQRGQAPKAQEDWPDWMRELDVVEKKLLRIVQLSHSYSKKNVEIVRSALHGSLRSPGPAALLEAAKKLQERKTDILKNGPNSA